MSLHSRLFLQKNSLYHSPVLLHEGRVVFEREQGRVVQRDAVVHHGSVGQSEMEIRKDV